MYDEMQNIFSFLFILFFLFYLSQNLFLFFLFILFFLFYLSQNLFLSFLFILFILFGKYRIKHLYLVRINKFLRRPRAGGAIRGA